MELRRVYVEVTAKFLREGGIVPLSLIWEGRTLRVGRAETVGRVPDRLSGFLPVCYECEILGRMRRIYFEPEQKRWFVEAFPE